MSDGPLLETVEVTRAFARGRAALQGVSLRIARGEFVALTGPSGGGKTTLLSLLGALDAPTEGRVVFEGRDVARLSQGERARIRRRLGIVFQHSHMLARLPVWENVTYPLVPRGAPAAERKRIARAWLARVELEDRADSRPEELSGGERRRVGIARALAGGPEVILADEPTSDLDEESAGIVRALFSEFLAGGGTLVLATHDSASDAGGARIVRLREGRVVPGGETRSACSQARPPSP